MAYRTLESIIETTVGGARKNHKVVLRDLYPRRILAMDEEALLEACTLAVGKVEQENIMALAIGGHDSQISSEVIQQEVNRLMIQFINEIKELIAKAEALINDGEYQKWVLEHIKGNKDWIANIKPYLMPLQQYGINRLATNDLRVQAQVWEEPFVRSYIMRAIDNYLQGQGKEI
jgi:hypothetical protein